MKQLICLLLLLCSGIGLAQEQVPPTTDNLKFNINARFQLLYPIHFGNTALNKAHNSGIGVSTQMNFLEYKHFKAGFGFDFVTYEITDKEVIANLSTSKYTSAYFLIGYDYQLHDKIRVFPNIGYGSSSLELGSRSSRFGKQSGKEFRIGTFVDYKIGKATYVFGGIHYVNNKFNINTAPEYESFFSKANQIQLNLGIRLGN